MVLNCKPVRDGNEKDPAKSISGDSRDPLIVPDDMTTYTYETIPDDPKIAPKRFEAQQKMSDPPLKVDPESGLPVRRVITGGSGNIMRGLSILSMNVKRSRK